MDSFYRSFGAYWLSLWADKNEADLSSAADNTLYYLGVYAGFGAGETLVEFFRELLLLLSCAKASSIVHQRLLRAVFRCPMSFFDTNPTGRIVNR